MKVLSREDMQKVRSQAKKENYYELFLLEFATGLRLGELMALQWDDVDLVTGELRINKQTNLAGSKLVISEPKTKAAVRPLILPPSVRKVLAEYKTRVNSRWLFPSPKKDDLPIIPSAVSRRLHLNVGRKQRCLQDIWILSRRISEQDWGRLLVGLGDIKIRRSLKIK